MAGYSNVMPPKLKQASFYRKKLDVLKRETEHHSYLQRWALKILEEVEQGEVKNETLQNFRRALNKDGADIVGPGHPHKVRVRAPKKPRGPPKEAYKFPRKHEIDREIERLSNNLVPFTDLENWEII